MACRCIMRNVRLKQMEQFIVEKKFSTIEEISEVFHIHPNTARADIRELAERGVVQKRYGGIEYVTPNLQISFDERRMKNVAAKRDIGRKAATLLEEDDVIYVDTGSTAIQLVQAGAPLPQRLTVISSSLEVLQSIATNTDYTLFALPGQLNRQINAFISLETIESLKTYNVNKCFIGARGVSAKGELSSASSIDAKVKSTAIDISQTIILMADRQKAEQTALFNFSTLSKIDYWVCDESTPVIESFSKIYNFRLIK